MIVWRIIIYCNSQGWESRHAGEYLDFRHTTRIAWHKQYRFWDEIVKGCVVSNTFFIQMGGPTTKPLGKKTKLTKRNANSVEMERWPHQSCGLRISIELFDRFSVEQIASSDFMNFWSRCVHRFWISKTKNLPPKTHFTPPKNVVFNNCGLLGQLPCNRFHLWWPRGRVERRLTFLVNGGWWLVVGMLGSKPSGFSGAKGF